MRHMNLQPEIDHIVQKTNDQIGNLNDEDISEEYVKLLAESIKKNIVEKYHLYTRDIKFIEKYLRKQEPDYFLVGLSGKNIKEEKYLESLQLLLTQINNSYVSERRNHRISFWSLIIAMASITIATISLIITIIKNTPPSPN